MSQIIDRQTFVISVNFATIPSQLQIPMNLRFSADELVLKSINYNVSGAVDTADIIQIWCNLTHDGLIGSFPNDGVIFQTHNDHFRLNNNFQSGNMILQFQQTSNGSPFYYNPQPLITANTNTKGIGVITIEFIKYEK